MNQKFLLQNFDYPILFRLLLLVIYFCILCMPCIAESSSDNLATTPVKLTVSKLHTHLTSEQKMIKGFHEDEKKDAENGEGKEVAEITHLDILSVKVKMLKFRAMITSILALSMLTIAFVAKRK